MESIVRDMRCPNCGSHALEPDKSSFGIFVCTMCGSKLSAKELANWYDTMRGSKLSAEERERQEEEKKITKTRMDARREFNLHVERYEKSKSLRELEDLEEYFKQFGISNNYARDCRTKIEKIKSNRIRYLLMIIVPLVIFLLGYLIFGEGFFEFLGVAGAGLIIIIVYSIASLLS